MRLTIVEKRVEEVNYCRVRVPVNYEEEDMPNDAPFRNGNVWECVIDVNNGKIIDWPQGKTLDFYMKVADGGVYTLLSANFETELAKLADYAPNNLLPGEYGDYLDFCIDENGHITNWMLDANLSDFEDDQ